eukprot:470114-Hanusia_phi.AAC.1
MEGRLVRLAGIAGDLGSELLRCEREVQEIIVVEKQMLEDVQQRVASSRVLEEKLKQTVKVAEALRAEGGSLTGEVVEMMRGFERSVRIQVAAEAKYQLMREECEISKERFSAMMISLRSIESFLLMLQFNSAALAARDRGTTDRSETERSCEEERWEGGACARTRVQGLTEDVSLDLAVEPGRDVTAREETSRVLAIDETSANVALIAKNGRCACSCTVHLDDLIGQTEMTFARVGERNPFSTQRCLQQVRETEEAQQKSVFDTQVAQGEKAFLGKPPHPHPHPHPPPSLCALTPACQQHEQTTCRSLLLLAHLLSWRARSCSERTRSMRKELERAHEELEGMRRTGEETRGKTCLPQGFPPPHRAPTAPFVPSSSPPLLSFRHPNSPLYTSFLPPCSFHHPCPLASSSNVLSEQQDQLWAERYIADELREALHRTRSGRAVVSEMMEETGREAGM